MKSIKGKVLLLLCIFMMCYMSAYAADWHVVARDRNGTCCRLDMSSIDRIGTNGALIWTKTIQPNKNRVTLVHVALNNKTGEYMYLKILMYTREGQLISYLNITNPKVYQIDNMIVMQRIRALLWRHI